MNEPKCSYTEPKGLWAPLVCGRERAHTGMHCDFRPRVTVGFGPRHDQIAAQLREAASATRERGA